MQKSALAISSLILTIGLTGCSPAGNFACDAFQTGDQIKSVQVSSDLTLKPEVTFPTPLSGDEVQSNVIVEGDGPVFTGRNLVDFEFAGYNGGNGQLIQQTEFDGINPATGFFGPNQVPNFCVSLAGVKEGSRIVTIMPPAEAHDSQGVPSIGVGPNDAFIFVFDIKKVYLEKATGSTVAPEAGLPAVVTTPDGIPGITIPKTEVPSELRIAQLISGSGEEVVMGDKVAMHYSGFLWSDGTKFDSSWDQGQPAQFDMVEGGLISGFLSAVVGQKVGTQVIAVIPPELGYGADGTGSIPPGATLIFVIDILGVRN